jgi:hypothetical protein
MSWRRCIVLTAVLPALIASCSGQGSNESNAGAAGASSAGGGGSTEQCATGLTSCDSGCVDLDADPANCGACGTTCGADQGCVDGSCIDAPDGPPGSGGADGSGGSTSSGGSPSSGGAPGAGGASGSGGAPGAGGATGSGGTPGAGGATGSGGQNVGTGGADPGTGGQVVGTGGSDPGTGGDQGTGGATTECTNVRPTGTDWDEATCDDWATQTEECDAAWMIDNRFCDESCGRCATTGTGGATGTGGEPGSGGAGTGGEPGSGGTPGSGGATSTGDVFDQCRFHFGAIDSYARQNNLAAQLDYFTPGWMGQSDTFDMGYVCDDAGPGGPLDGLVPAVVAYVIAFAARRDEGLQDCNVSGSTNLCLYGATYIRNNMQRILNIYDSYARGYASCWGTSRPIIFLMEPDYYQYYAGGDANALSPQEAGQFMGQIVSTMRQSLPNAVFSLDISPWIPDQGADWYPNFTLSDFTFINTSGGGTDADSDRIRQVNDMTWGGVSGVTGKPILADTGYGAAGSSEGHDTVWDVPSNINARIADGVVGINQYNPNSNWGSTISQIRGQLDTPRVCP